MLALLTSCEMIVDVDLPDAPDKLVVNCLFETGQPFKIHLSRSMNVLSGDSSIINDGQVKIYADGSYIGDLEYIGDGVYSSDIIIALPEVTYKLMASAPGYDEVWAEDSAPVASLMDTIFYDHTKYYDSEGVEYYKLQLSIWDDPATTGYYELICKLVSTYYVSIRGFRGDNERVLINEGDEDFYSWITVFKDELIDETPYMLKLKAQEKYWEKEASIYLLSISENMYRYRKSWIRHDYAQSPDILEQIEPVTLFSNIEGGYGIFAGYSISSIVTGDNSEQR